MTPNGCFVSTCLKSPLLPNNIILYVWQKSSAMYTDKKMEQSVKTRHFMQYREHSNKTLPHDIGETAILLHGSTVIARKDV